MNYTVITFRRGLRDYTKAGEAESLQDAARKFSTMGAHCIVTGEDGSVGRFKTSGKPLTEPMKAYPAFHAKKPAVLILIGEIAEIHTFNTIKERNEALERIWKKLESAESAKETEQPTDTTASTEETSGSKSGSTDQKTLSGSATNAIWQDLLTPSTIEKLSGKGKSSDTGGSTCSRTSEASPSKQNPKTWKAKVLRLPREEQYGYPGWTYDMKQTEGKIITVTEGNQRGIFRGNGWAWREEWLEFIEDEEKVHKIVPLNPEKVNCHKTGFVDSMKQCTGETLDATEMDTIHYVAKGWCWYKDWVVTVGDKVVLQNCDEICIPSYHDGETAEIVEVKERGKMHIRLQGLIFYITEAQIAHKVG